MKYFFVLLTIGASLFGKEVFQNFPVISRKEFPYRSPSARHIDAYGWDAIAGSLKDYGLSMVHRNLFDRICHREEVGFVGYHGSTQQFRIFQDIIRLVIEEIIDLPLREDFEFFRVPGDPLFSGEELDRRSSFLYLNYAIYGNFNSIGSSSYNYFTSNGSSSFVDYRRHLYNLFSCLGISSGEVHKLFDIGRKHTNQESGVIYQIYDMSHYDPRKSYYQLADQQCLWLQGEVVFSKMIVNTYPTLLNREFVMRMNNQFTLNPYSSLVVRRYDKISAEETKIYMSELRSAVRSLDFSKEKALEYRELLLSLWRCV